MKLTLEMPDDEAMALADERLYRAKHAGRNCVCTE